MGWQSSILGRELESFFNQRSLVTYFFVSGVKTSQFALASQQIYCCCCSQFSCFHLASYLFTPVQLKLAQLARIYTFPNHEGEERVFLLLRLPSNPASKHFSTWPQRGRERESQVERQLDSFRPGEVKVEIKKGRGGGGGGKSKTQSKKCFISSAALTKLVRTYVRMHVHTSQEYMYPTYVTKLVSMYEHIRTLLVNLLAFVCGCGRES